MKHGATRRGWMAGIFAGAGAALVGCAARKTPAAPAEVSITRAPAYDQTLYAAVRRALGEHRLDVRGRNVVLKPNLVEYEPGSVINTHPVNNPPAEPGALELGPLEAASGRCAAR